MPNTETVIRVERKPFGSTGLIHFEAFFGDSPWRVADGHVDTNNGVRLIAHNGGQITVEAARNYARAILAVCDAVENEPLEIKEVHDGR